MANKLLDDIYRRIGNSLGIHPVNRGFVMTAICLCVFQSCATDPIRRQVFELNPGLEELLGQYEEDSLKHKAALFLIDNLAFHSGAADGSGLHPMYRAYELFGTGKFTPEQSLDSVKREFGSTGITHVQAKSDIYIDPGYFAENLDWAFKVWREQPWGRNVPFEQFCEYILPYRVGNEELIPWREKIYNQFMPLIEKYRSDPKIEDPTFAAHIVLDSLLRAPFYFTEQISTDVRVGPRIVDWRGGSCLDLCDMLVFIYRALGIPCGIETMPMRGNNNAPHFWNFMEDKEGRTWYFSMFYWWHRLMEAEKYGDVYGKIFRSRFSLNRKLMEEMQLPQKSLHPAFQYPCFEDVTAVYAAEKSRRLEIPASRLLHEIPDGEMIYLCMSSRFHWIPVGWDLYDGNAAFFEDCHGGTVYCLATYRAEDGSLSMVTDPFSVNNDDGSLTFYTPENETEDVVLFSKFGMIGEFFLGRMTGGVFEGSNDKGFNQKDTLYEIETAPERLCTSVCINTDRKYRYIRYFGPEDGYCNISEAEFYDEEGERLEGDILGPAEGGEGDHSYFNVFDGKTDTSYDHPSAYGGWAGLDLGSPKKISRIVYTPRNRDNFVRKGDRYELFACHGGTWRSYGVKVSEADSLRYAGIPKHALLLLRNHTRGVAERLFEYKDGKQVYW